MPSLIQLASPIASTPHLSSYLYENTPKKDLAQAIPLLLNPPMVMTLEDLLTVTVFMSAVARVTSDSQVHYADGIATALAATSAALPSSTLTVAGSLAHILSTVSVTDAFLDSALDVLLPLQTTDNSSVLLEMLYQQISLSTYATAAAWSLDRKVALFSALEQTWTPARNNGWAYHVKHAVDALAAV